MNHYFNKLFIILIMLASGQSLFAQAEADNQKKTDIKEDFITFLDEFSNSRYVQRTRLLDDILECTITLEGDSTCQKLSRKKWKHVRLTQGNSYNQIYTNFKMKIVDTDERVFSIEAFEGGSSTYYFFQRVNQNWYLVKRIVYL